MEHNNVNIIFEPNTEPVVRNDAATAFLMEAARKGLEKQKSAPPLVPEVPLWEKYTLTIREAAEYFHIGEKRLRQIVEENLNSDFVVTNGNRAMIKRKAFEKYIDNATVV